MQKPRACQHHFFIEKCDNFFPDLDYHYFSHQPAREESSDKHQVEMEHNDIVYIL